MAGLLPLNVGWSVHLLNANRKLRWEKASGPCLSWAGNRHEWPLSLDQAAHTHQFGRRAIQEGADARRGAQIGMGEQPQARAEIRVGLT